MSSLTPWGAVTGPTAPHADPAHLDGELLDLLCEDPTWVEETFWSIVAADRAQPPHGALPASAAGPRRSRRTERSSEPRGRGSRGQWEPRVRGRQRSPPVSAGR